MASTTFLHGDGHPLLKSKSPSSRLQNYDQKLQSSMQLNAKLKELLQTMRNNSVARKAEQSQRGSRGTDDEHIQRLRRKQLKLISWVQQLTNNLNVLVSENGKLKAQVDISRNSRVIYSNVYKTIQKEIRKNQYLYKLAIIDYLCYEEVEKRAKDRVAKMSKRIEKDIGELQGNGKAVKKNQKEKRKSRLDTGLSHRMESMDTCRNSEDRTLRQNPSAPSRRDPQNSRREMLQRVSNHKIQPISLAALQPKEQKTERVARSRAHIQLYQVDDYYQLQMKSNYYDNVMKHLRQITSHDHLQSIISEWEGIDSQLEREYAEYLDLEAQAKSVREEREQLEGQLVQSSQKEIGGDGTEEERQLQVVMQQIQAQRIKMAHLQQKLTEIIDINSSKLTEEQITQHVQRVNRRGDATIRQLQKLLQSVNKEKISVGNSRVTAKTNNSRLV